MIKSYKVKLKLNNKQRTYLTKCSNVSRWAYNWALGQEKENYEINKENPDKKTHFINNFELRKKLTVLKQNNENFKWLYDYDCDIVKQSIKDAEKSFLDFFKHKTGFPKFKSKRKTKPSGVKSFLPLLISLFCRLLTALPAPLWSTEFYCFLLWGSLLFRLS
jgi:putative transposase